MVNNNNRIIQIINTINNNDQHTNNNIISILNDFNKNEIINNIIECLEIIKSLSLLQDKDFINIFSKNKIDTLIILHQIFESIYLLNSIEYNLIVSKEFNKDNLKSLLDPIFNLDLNLFLKIYKVIIECKIKSNDILTIENTTEIQYFYSSLKLILMKSANKLQNNRTLLILISSIIIKINENSILGLFKVEDLLAKPLIIKFIKIIVEDINNIPIIINDNSNSNSNNSNSNNRELYNENITVYIKTIRIFWNNNQLSIIQQTIEEMFSIIIKDSNNNNSSSNSSSNNIDSGDEDQIINSKSSTKYIYGSIVNILNISPIELIPLFINIIDNGRVLDSNLLEVISKLTKYPLTETTSKWILETFNSLIKSKKTTLLASIVIECAESIIRQMFILELLPSSYEILEKMLLGYQHSPDIFHSIIHLFPVLIEFLFTIYNRIKNTQDDSSTNSDLIPIIKYDIQVSVNKILSLEYSSSSKVGKKELLLFSIQRLIQPSRFKKSIYLTLNKFYRLSWILIYHHTGYPELYLELIQILQKISSHFEAIPSEFEIKKQLEENAWSSLDSLVFENIRLKRVLTDRAGLINLGNTCYMNSFLQALYMTIPFRDLLLKKIDNDLLNLIKFQLNNSSNNNNGNNNNNGSGIENYDQENLKLMEQKYSREIMKRPQLLKQIQLLFANLRISVKESLSPDQFLKCLSKEYQSGLQHDSFEFGKSLLDSLDLIFKNMNKEKELEFERLQKKQKITLDQDNNLNNGNSETTSTSTPSTKSETSTFKSEISKLFGGKLSNKIICRNCKNESIKIEDYLELQLSFNDYKKESYTLEEMVHQFLSNEELINDNKYHCEKCNGLQDADKVIELNSTPQHLILGINRFYFSRESKSISKLLNNVNYPLDIQLPYKPLNNNSNNNSANTNSDNSNNNNMNQSDDNNNNNNSIKYSNYSLYAIIMHSGKSPNHGHYYCYAKPSNSTQLDWCLFNDSLVQISDITTIQNISKRFFTDVPYILFYVKNDKEASNDINNNINDNTAVTTWIKNQIEKENQLLLSKYNKNSNNKNLLLEQFHVYGQFKNE